MAWHSIFSSSLFFVPSNCLPNLTVSLPPDLSIYTRVACPGTGSKSAKSESAGAVAKSSKSEAAVGTGPILECEAYADQGTGCYQRVATCPDVTEEEAEAFPDCNGLEAIGEICEGAEESNGGFFGDVCSNGVILDNEGNFCETNDGEPDYEFYVRVSCPGASKSAKSESIGDWSKSAKSEWEGVGEWSKSAKSDDGSAKASKSEWEGVGEWSKSAKSDSSAKSAKAEMIEVPPHPEAEWTCGWKIPGDLPVTVEDAMAMLEGLDLPSLLEDLDVSEESVMAALEALKDKGY